MIEGHGGEAGEEGRVDGGDDGFTEQCRGRIERLEIGDGVAGLGHAEADVGAFGGEELLAVAADAEFVGRVVLDDVEVFFRNHGR